MPSSIRSPSHGTESPPGVESTSSAAPAHTNSIERVTTMSGTRLITTSVPFTRPMRMPMMSTTRTIGTESSGALSRSTAEMTFVNAMTDPIDRSIPPEITTIACPAAANATGSEATARASSPYAGRRISVNTKSATNTTARPMVHASPPMARASRSRQLIRSAIGSATTVASVDSVMPRRPHRSAARALRGAGSARPPWPPAARPRPGRRR